MAIRGATSRPSTLPVSRISSLSIAVRFPVAVPRMVIVRANTSGPDHTVPPHRQAVFWDRHLSFDTTLDDQVLAGSDLALDDDRASDRRDSIGNVQVGQRHQVGDRLGQIRIVLVLTPLRVLLPHRSRECHTRPEYKENLVLGTMNGWQSKTGLRGAL